MFLVIYNLKPTKALSKYFISRNTSVLKEHEYILLKLKHYHWWYILMESALMNFKLHIMKNFIH